jgi:polyisoprenyl-phosphate glycosyltransferase
MADMISVVVPCFNEQAVIREANDQLIEVLEHLPLSFEILYIDDGSTDGTPEILREFQMLDERIKVVRLSRNFGHQIAITAGLEHAGGDAVVIIDADLQDPPNVIPDFVAKWMDGFDVVFGVRFTREGETRFKLWTAKLFYRLIGNLSDTAIPVDTGDFRLMSRRVLNALLAMPERDRFVRGMVSWLGFAQAGVPYRRNARAAGKTKFSLFKMLHFAIDGIVSFSILPLRIATYMGFTASLVAILGGLVAVTQRMIGVQGLVKGWASILVAILFIGGVQLICMGIVGEYIGRIYGESKRRPLYVVEEMMGFQVPNQSETRRSRRQVAVVNRQFS